MVQGTDSSKDHSTIKYRALPYPFYHAMPLMKRGYTYMPKKQTDGRYRAKIRIGVESTGKEIVKYVSANTIRVLEVRKQQTYDKYIGGSRAMEDCPLGPYLERWYKLRKEPFLSKSSKAAYKGIVYKRIIPRFGNRQIRAISAADMQSFMNEFLGMSDTTIGLVATILKGVFLCAYSDGLILTNPALALMRPKASKGKEKRALTLEERRAVLNTVKTHKDGHFLAVLYYLGLRRGEALGLQWGDFLWEDGLVHIQRDVDFAGTGKAELGSLKTEAANRYVTIPEELYEILYPIRGVGVTLVFPGKDGKPMGKSTFDNMWISLMLCANLVTEIENPKYSDLRFRYRSTISPHYFRHNYITILHDAGIDPLVTMRLVGHKDYKTTANIYTHLTNEHLRMTAAKLNHAFDTRPAPAIPPVRWGTKG